MLNWLNLPTAFKNCVYPVYAINQLHLKHMEPTMLICGILSNKPRTRRLTQKSFFMLQLWGSHGIGDLFCYKQNQTTNLAFGTELHEISPINPIIAARGLS